MWRSVILSLTFFSPALLADASYTVQFDDRLEWVRIKACFEGSAPRQLTRNAMSGRFTEWVRTSEGKELAASGGTRLRLNSLADNSCLEWQVDLAAAAAADRRLALDAGGSLLTDADLWFWRDDERRQIEVKVELPAGYSISVPWRQLPADDDRQRYEVDPTPAAWSSRIAVGRFPVHRVPMGGRELHVAVVGEPERERDEVFRRWIQETAQSVAAVYGRFPQEDVQILIVPLQPQREPVPWARVLRGGGVAAEFYVDQTSTLDELRRDWTATHELSHMLLPYVSSRDRWLSEGLASYYQNVLRARDGRLSEQEAWQRLHAGFERGRRATREETLSEATRSGWSATMRVYWSGAAMMLKADSRLRALSNGEQSLDSALEMLGNCCMTRGRNWRAKGLFAELDRLTGFTVFSDLYDNHVLDNEFPDVQPTCAKLGIVPRYGSITIDDDAPWNAIRMSIMSG